MSQLKQIFESITPENIKNIPLLKHAMDIFIENLEENSKISQDIKEIYNNSYDDRDSEHLAASKKVLKEALLSTYVAAFYRIISEAQKNDLIKLKLEESGLELSPFINDVDRILTDEHFFTNKSFKEKVGTITSIGYAYNLTKYLEAGETDDDIRVTELSPFHFRSEGSTIKEMYEHIVKPLSHPLGFTYVYNQIIKESLQDLFGVEVIYDVNGVEIRNIDGRIHVFTSETDVQAVKESFVGTHVNPLTGAAFTAEEYDELVTVTTGKVVQTFTDEIIGTRTVKTIIFDDNTILFQKTNPLEITYSNYSNWLAGSSEQIFDYNDSHWAVYVDYSTDFELQYSDNIDLYRDIFEVTKIKEENNGSEGQKYYNLTSGEYAFHVGGDEYLFAPGQDEVLNIYDDASLINDEINQKFVIEIYGVNTLMTQTEIIVKDEYGTSAVAYVMPDAETGEFSVPFNTYQLNGDVYTLSVSTILYNTTYSWTIKTTGLNNFNRLLGFYAVTDNYEQISNTLKVEGFGPIGETVQLTLTDSVGFTNVQSGVVQGDGKFEIILSMANMEYGNYRIDAVIFAPNGKPLYTSFFEGDNLRTRVDDIIISSGVFDYSNGAPEYATINNYTELLGDTSDMPGINTYNSTILKQIGELSVNDTYAEPDKDLLLYMITNGISDFNNIPDTIIINGSYIEGNNYDRSSLLYLEEEETFIDYGRRVYPIDTSDFIIVTSSDYTTDDVTIYALSSTGYYLYTDESVGNDYYLYSNEGFYLTTLGDES